MQTQQHARQDKRNLAYYVNYYFNLNPHTIQGRLTIGFLLMGALSVALVVVTHIQWRAGVRQTQYALTVATVSRYYSADFESSCKDLLVNDLAAADITDETVEAAYKHAIASRDTLLKLSTQWKTDRERRLLAEADAHFLQLRSVLQKDDSAAAAKAMPVLQALRSSISELVKIQSAEILAARTSILAVQQRLDWLVPLYISFAFVLAYFVGSFMIVGILAYVKQFKKHLRELGKGNLPEAMPETKNEMNALVKEINLLTDNLGQIKDFALYVGKGEFEKNIKVFNDEGDLGVSLAQMRDELKKVALEEKKRFWSNEGLAHFGTIIHGSHDINELCDKIVRQLVKYLHVNQAGLFVVENESTGQPNLSLKACYAYDRKKHTRKEIQPGQGLVGQAWQEGETTYLRQIPENYLRITSGLGDASPRYLLIVPLKINGGIQGIVELASFRDFEPHEIRFVEAIGENIASTLANAKISGNTQLLLEQSRGMAEQMAAQEEQMRQHMEELMTTQEEMSRSQRETAHKQAALDALLNNSSFASVTIDTKYRVVAANAALKKIYEKLGVSMDVGSQVLDIFRKHFGEAAAAKRKAQYDRAFAGETFTDHEETLMNGRTMYTEIYHNPIKDERGEIHGVAISAKDVSVQKYRERQLEQDLQAAQQENETLAQRVEELTAQLSAHSDQPAAPANTGLE